MKAVIYARYSSDSQREESIEGQLRECKEFAEKNGITILNSYIDRALSAKTDNRPEFQRMIKDSGKCLFDVVLVWKLDRFARNRYDSAHYKATLRRNGVKVISATEAISEDSTGILLESLLEGYAEFYSAELSEKVTRGMTENALKCKYNGGGIPVGYIIDNEQHYQLDPLTSTLVLETFKRYDKGATIAELVRWLNKKNIKPHRGKTMSIDSVKRLLKNRRYIGEYRYSKTVIPNGVPAIVPQDLFDRVQERLVKNKKSPARFKAKDELYLLSTKLHCGLCESFMVGESGTSSTEKFYQYYKCVSAKNHKGCKKKSVKKTWIEDIVVNATMEMILDDTVVEYIADLVMEMQSRENMDLPRFKEQLGETEKAISNMLNAIQQGIFNKSTKERLDELETVKSDLEVKIIQEEMHRPMLKKEHIIFWIHRFRKLDITKPEQRQRLIDSFVNAIYIFDDKLVITFNYKKACKTVSLCDIIDAVDKTAPRSDLCAVDAPMDMAEPRLACETLQTALDSGSSRSNSVEVQVLLGAPIKSNPNGSDFGAPCAPFKSNPIRNTPHEKNRSIYNSRFANHSNDRLHKHPRNTVVFCTAKHKLKRRHDYRNPLCGFLRRFYSRIRFQL
jgi:Site-specific recombinases, DNA invertase Pin homologs